MPSNKQTGAITIPLLVILVVIFAVTLFFSTRGWGYMGYSGYHRGPSFWYWGGPSIYQSRSARHGSVGGPGHMGGGIGGGK